MAFKGYTSRESTNQRQKSHENLESNLNTLKIKIWYICIFVTTAKKVEKEQIKCKQMKKLITVRAKTEKIGNKQTIINEMKLSFWKDQEN